MNRQMYRYCPYCATPLEDRLVEARPRRVCPSCDFIHFADPKVAVIAQVECDGRVLLVRRAVDPARGHWALPGGYMDAGEWPEVALRRELREEVGLAIDVGELLAIFPLVSASGAQGIVLAYRGEPAGKTALPIQVDDDVDGAGWFGPDELPEALAFESTQRLLGEWAARAKLDNST